MSLNENSSYAEYFFHCFYSQSSILSATSHQSVVVAVVGVVLVVVVVVVEKLSTPQREVSFHEIVDVS